MSESPWPSQPSGADAQRALHGADQTRRAFVSLIKTPPGYDPLYALATGMVVAGIGVNNATRHASRRLIVCVMLYGGALAIFAFLLRYFRAANGVWLSGLRRGRTGWVAAAHALQQLDPAQHSLERTVQSADRGNPVVRGPRGARSWDREQRRQALRA